MDWIINASTKLFGVIGRNIQYSLSPPIHNYVFRKTGHNAVYLAFDIPEERFQYLFPALMELCEGLNITIPYKEKVIGFLEDLDPIAKAIGAVNTVHKGVGYNTDYIAIEVLVKENLNNLDGDLCYIYGAGGAARAAAFALGKLGCRIVIINRSRSRAEKLVKDLAEYGVDAEIGESCENRSRVVANATPNPEIVPEVCLNTDVVIEFVYRPVETQLVVKAKMRGIKVINGLEILVKQALEAQEIWFGEVRIPYEEVIGYLYARKLVW
ncbi:MAG: shikimate dehydrogenase [Ignisphaera sp.]|uniref:Shikimate dehydrogenase (NADP(+)) n=1 Tax=Ignisphaera aggregans TaxID=334771 RepID=A0A7J3MY66_9CREN